MLHGASAVTFNPARQCQSDKPFVFVGVSQMKNLFNRFVREDAGQDLIEYALLIGIIAIALMTVLPSIGGKVLAKFQALDNAL